MTWAGTIVVGVVIALALWGIAAGRKPRANVAPQPVPSWFQSPFGRLGFVLGIAGFMGYNYTHSAGGFDTAAGLAPVALPDTYADATPPVTPDTSSIDFSGGGDFT